VELGGFAPPSEKRRLDITTCVVGLIGVPCYPQANKATARQAALVLNNYSDRNCSSLTKVTPSVPAVKRVR